MTAEQKFRFVARVQRNQVLAAGGILVIENSFPEMLRRPRATGTQLYIALCALKPGNGMWFLSTVRREVTLQAAKLGVHLLGIALSCAIRPAYACVACAATGTRGTASGDEIQALLCQAAKALQTIQPLLNEAMNPDPAQAQADNGHLMQVQLAMQRENQVYTTVSNVLKTRSKTAKHSIDNLR